MLKKYEDFKKLNEMKKFSNISKDKSNSEKSESSSPVNTETNIQDTKTHSDMKSSKIKPNDESEYHDKDYKPSQNMGTTNMSDDDSTNESKEVRLVGKVAKFPKNTKASNAYNFLENVKISKNKIWYILVEKQDNELQMVKYSTKSGVNLSEFVNELKNFYIEKYKGDDKLVRILEKIELVGDENGNYSSIKNIPNLSVDGKKLIRKITEDLTNLLSGKLDGKRRRK